MERLPEKIASIVLFSTASTLAWENSQHLVTLQLVSPPNDVWETSAEIPYWWPVTTQICVVLLIGWIKFPSGTINQKHYPDMGSDGSLVWNFCTRFSDVIWLRLLQLHFRYTRAYWRVGDVRPRKLWPSTSIWPAFVCISLIHYPKHKRTLIFTIFLSPSQSSTCMQGVSGIWTQLT